MGHYDREKERDIDRIILKGEKIKPKLDRTGELVFLLALGFIVVSVLLIAL